MVVNEVLYGPEVRPSIPVRPDVLVNVTVAFTTGMLWSSNILPAIVPTFAVVKVQFVYGRGFPPRSCPLTRTWKVVFPIRVDDGTKVAMLPFQLMTPLIPPLIPSRTMLVVVWSMFSLNLTTMAILVDVALPWGENSMTDGVVLSTLKMTLAKVNSTWAFRSVTLTM